MCVFVTNVQSQTKVKNEKVEKTGYKHSFDTSPLSPFLQMNDIGIWGVHYNYHFTDNDEVILGLSYMNMNLKHNDVEIGTTNSPGLIVGYRRYLWNNLHIEYQIWFCYDNYHEKIENKYYKSFDIWNEFRFGYQFNFKAFDIPLYTSVQWPFGFGLYASNKPESFNEREKENRYFYHFPLIFVGLKF
jgi:hypothetical protein